MNIIRGFLQRLFYASFIACAIMFGANSAFAACASNEIDVLGDGSSCETSKFEFTTKANQTSNYFTMSAQGTFYVDCGDGGTLTSAADPTDVSGKTISRADTTVVEYTCTWDSPNAHTIKLGGVATGYNPEYNPSTIRFYGVTSISGSLGALFPQLGSNDGQFPHFYQTFVNEDYLTLIPSELFKGGNLTGGSYMFFSTFSGCDGLTEIPPELFSTINTPGQDMFRSTFLKCANLTTIPNNLFSGITSAATNMFYQTFSDSTNMSGFIPKSTFSGLIANNHPSATDMWYRTFSGTSLVTTCPNGTQQYNTGYESEWNGFVSCECGIGYYEDDTTCIACTNTKPSHSSYSGNATSNSCPWECDNGYYTNGNSCTACTNSKPVHSSYSGNATSNSCPWKCDTGYKLTNGICETLQCSQGQFLADNTCQTTKFSVTTTSDATSIDFVLSAVGTFYVDCGEDGTLLGTGVSGKIILREDTAVYGYTCSYSSASEHTIKFGGSATGYNTGTSIAAISFGNTTNGTQLKIASVSGSLSTLFPQFGFNDGEFPRFYRTFRGAKNLTSIPTELFNGGNLTGGSYMFFSTFYSCSGLLEIPQELFSSITNGAQNMFRSTFYKCDGLTSIPGNLFSKITSVAQNMFYQTFKNCVNLSGYIPPTTFAGLIMSDITKNTNMWQDTFAGTNLATQCSSYGLPQYETGYEGSTNSTTWNTIVSCGCAGGQYINNNGCSACNNSLPQHAAWDTNSLSATCPWTCNPGYTEYKNACHGFCSGNRKLRIGTNPITTYPAFSDKTNVPSPVLHIKDVNDEICYIYFEPDVGGEHGVKVLWTDGKKYHAVDPTQ